MQMFIRKEHGITALKKTLANSTQLPNSAIEKLRGKIQSLEKQLSQAEQRYEAARNTHAELAQTKQRLREKDHDMSKSQSSIRALEQRISELEELTLRSCPECGEKFQIREELIKTSWLDGRFQGFYCPKNGCKGVALWQRED
jgi:phage shock protein A